MGRTIGTAYLAATTTGDENTDGVVSEITEEWFVRTAFNASLNTALAATGLPASNAAYASPYDYLRVSSRRPTREDNGIIWRFEIVYKPVSVQAETYRLVHIEYGTHEIQEDVTHNLGTGQILLDANQKPFQQTIQESISYPFIKLVKKQGSVDRESVIRKSGTINNAAVVVAGVTIPKWAGKLKINAIEQENEAAFNWEISWEVQVKYFSLSNYLDFAAALKAGPDEVGWMQGIINQGFYYYDGGTDLVRATEIVKKADGSSDERPSATPVSLDSDGTRLTEGATPQSILLQTIPSSDWSELGLNEV